MSTAHLTRTHRAVIAATTFALGTLAVVPAAIAADPAWTFTTTKNGSNVTFDDGASHAAQIAIEDSTGSTLWTYCVQRHVTTSPGDGKTEIDWDESGIDNLPKVAWVLNHSFPNLTVDELDADVDAYAAAHDLAPVTLDETEAVAATQAAIWHFTDQAVLTPGANDRDIELTYDYLTSALNQGQTETARLGVSGPTTVTQITEGDVGFVGPFTIDSNVEEVSVTTGNDLDVYADRDGAPVTTAVGGQRLWVKVPAGFDGTSVTLTVAGKGYVKPGRVFAPINPDAPTQTLIVAQTQLVPISATAEGTWQFVAAGTEDPGPTDPSPTTPGTPGPTPDDSTGAASTPAPTATSPATPTPAPTTQSDDSASTIPVTEDSELAHTGATTLALVIGGALLAAGVLLAVATRRRTSD